LKILRFGERNNMRESWESGKKCFRECAEVLTEVNATEFT